MKMAVLSRKDLIWLAGPRPWPCLTIYSEVKREGYQPEAVLRRLSDIASKLEESLIQAGVHSKTIDTLLKPIRQLDTLGLQALYHDFRGFAVASIAFFICPDGSRGYVSRELLPQKTVISPYFEVRPLLSATSSFEEFFILAASPKEVKLWLATPRTIEAVDLPQDVPVSLDAFLSSTEFSPKLAYHAVGSNAPGTKVGKWYGTVARDEDDQVMDDFALCVARPLVPILKARQIPVVLVAMKNLAVSLRKHLKIPWLLDDDISLSPEHLSLQEMEQKGREQIKTLDDRIAAEEVVRLKEHFGTPRTATTCDDIWQAAKEGKIDVLLTHEEDDVPLEDDRKELVSAVVHEVMNHKGRVLLTKDPFLLKSCPMGALLRWV